MKHLYLKNITLRLPANITEGNQLTPSFKLIGDTLKRLFQNKILMFDTLSLVFFLFAHANGNYLAKFIEFQFHVSPSKASLVSGTTRWANIIYIEDNNIKRANKKQRPG